MRQVQLRNAAKAFPIERRGSAAMCNPVFDVWELRLQHSRVNIVQKRSGPMKMVFAGGAVFAVVAHAAYGLSDFRVIRGDGAAVADASESFERVKAEASDHSQ